MRPRRLALPASLALGLLARWRWRNWGAVPAERTMRVPGEELLRGATTSVTRAVAIDADAEDVWPWLVQLGQGRGGMYSYDWLENLLGLNIHSADRIHPEHQHLAVGDRITLVHDGWMGGPGYALPVAAVEPGRAIVLRQQPPEHPWDAIWTFLLFDDGPGRCRLVSRSTSVRPAGWRGALAAVMGELMDPVTLVMTRRMLLGIKERAEAHRAGVVTLAPVVRVAEAVG